VRTPRKRSPPACSVRTSACARTISGMTVHRDTMSPATAPTAWGSGWVLHLSDWRRNRASEMADAGVVVPSGWTRPGVGSGQYAPAMANFAVTMVHDDRWDPSRQIRDQEAWNEHAAFMDGLVDDGFVILGGPIGDGERALHVVEAADEDEIRMRLDEDPWASMGLLRIGTIEPWALWLDGRQQNPAR